MKNDIDFTIGFKVNEEELKALTRKTVRGEYSFVNSDSKFKNFDITSTFKKQQAVLKRQRTQILNSIRKLQSEGVLKYGYNPINDTAFLNNRTNRIARRLSPDQEKALQKLSLQKEMAEMKKAFKYADTRGMEDNFTDDKGNFHLGRRNAIKKYSDAEQALKGLSAKRTKEKDAQRENKKARKESVEEEKALNREHDAGIIKLFKISAILYGIKKLLQGMKNIWKFTVGQNLATTASDIQEKGFFSVDAHGSQRANVDKEHAAILRGTQHYGSASPFSISDFDNAVKQLQELRNKVESGEGIGNDQYVISLDRLSKRLGLSWNVAEMMTNPNLDLTNMISEAMNVFEKFLPNLDKLNDIDKSLTIKDALEVFGGKLTDAMMYNANLNARGGDGRTLLERTKAAGANAYSPIDYTISAQKFADEFAQAVADSKQLKTAFAAFATPFAEEVTKRLRVFGGAVTNELNLSNLASMGKNTAGALLIAGDYKYLKRDKEEEREALEWYDRNKSKIAQKLEDFGKNGINSDADLLYQIFYGSDAARTGQAPHNLEALSLHGFATKFNRISEDYKSTRGKPISVKGILTKYKDKLTSNEIYALEKILEYYPSLNNVTPRNFDDWRKELGKALYGSYKEGGRFDVRNGEHPKAYLLRMLGIEGYNDFIYDLLLNKGSVLGAGGVYKGARVTNDANNDNILDGQITITLVRTDGTTDTATMTDLFDGTKKVVNLSVDY